MTAYKCPAELDAPKEKVVVNDGCLQRLLPLIYSPKQRLETSATKDRLLRRKAAGLGNAGRFLHALVSMSGRRLRL